MSETRMEQKIDIPALRGALAKATPISGTKMTSHHIVSKGYEHMANLCRENMTCIAMTFKEESDAIAAVYTALPALLDELEELRALTTPEVIGEKHCDGEDWMCWVPTLGMWRVCHYDDGAWHWDDVELCGTPTHALPMPGQPEGVKNA